MKICVAQTRPVKGDVQQNIEGHKKLIDLAVQFGAGLIVFPELSLTGYEPTLAENLAIHPNDGILNDFQKISDENKLAIGVGMPTKTANGICISMIIFQPHQPRTVYSKKYIHPDEEPYFISGPNFPIFKLNNTKIALAICYELSIPQHAEKAFENGAGIYLASVAKSAKGVKQASERFSEIARKYSMTVLMSNCTGPSDDFESVGRSAIWNSEGILLSQLGVAREGILMIDTATQELVKKVI